MPKNKVDSIVVVKRALGFITTLLIVAGIAVVGYIISTKKTPEPAGLKADSSPVIQEPQNLPFSLIMPNESSVTVLDRDGKTERLSFAEFNDRFKEARLPVAGALAANGEVRYLRFPLDGTSTAPGHVAPDGQTTAWLAAAAKDGASVMAIKKGPAREEKMVLRTPQNKPIKEAVFLGWFDEISMAVVARADQEKCVYAVNLNGVVRQIMRLPENAIFYTVKGGYFWYATGTMGEGLETPPTGPSEFYRLSLNGVTELAVKDQKKTFVSVVSDARDYLAVTTNDSDSYITRLGSGDARIEIGERRPLLFSKSGLLIARQGFDLMLIESATGEARKIVTLPEGLAEVFIYEE